MPPMRLRLFAAAVAATLASVVAGAEAPAATSAPTIDWTVATPGTSPPYLAYAAGAYDAYNSTFVMFGGVGANGALSGTTWVWNGSNWHAFSGGPPARDLASMAFDPSLKQFILFGGQNAQGLLADTWAWNGASWCELSAGNGLGGTCSSAQLQAPSPRAGATLAFDAAGALVLFGGTGYASPATSPTTGGTSGGPAQVPPAEVTLGDTWQWEGSHLGWVQARVTGPPARSGATASYDVTNHTTVLFGGESTVTTAGQPKLLSDTWIWNGRSWARANPGVSPPARFAAVSDDDTAAGGPLVAGGQGLSGAQGDSWIWAGGNWVAVESAGENPAREAAAGGYMATSGQFVVFGGSNGAQTFDMTTLGTVVPNRTSPGGSSPTTTAPPRATTTKPGSTKPGRTTTTTLRKITTTTVGRHLTSPSSQAPPSQTAWITTSATKLQRGSSVHVNGAGFEGGTLVTLTFHSSPSNLGTASTGPGGGFQAEVTVPRNATAGPHTIEATGVEANGQTVSARATVYVSTPSKTSTATKAFLIGLAILVPVATYLAMMLSSALRSRRLPVTSPGTAPRSPS
jgi:hypothetical protein